MKPMCDEEVQQLVAIRTHDAQPWPTLLHPNCNLVETYFNIHKFMMITKNNMIYGKIKKIKK